MRGSQVRLLHGSFFNPPSKSKRPNPHRDLQEARISMSKRDFYQDASYNRPGAYEEEWDRAKWDREHWERWMDTVRSNQRDPDESYGSMGGTPYEGGVFSSGSYGGGAEFYSVTGMYE